ncbi:MAG: TolC family protein, partial [Rhodothermales bacterium]
MLIRRNAPQRRWPTWLIAGILLIYTPTVQAQHEDRPITLQAAIARSLEAGTHVRRAGARQEAARAAAGPLSSEYIPSARVTASSTLSQYPLTVTPIREQGVFPPLDDQIQEVSFNLSWTVFDFGQGRAARRSAQALAEAAGVEYDLARMETVERVTTAYVHLAHLTSIRDAQQDRLDALNERRAELTALHDEGRVPDVELLRIAEVVLSAETDLRKTRNDVASVLLELSGTLNMPETLDIEDIALFPLVAAKASPAAVDPAASPRVTLARKTLEAARFSAREADRSSFPAIELFAAERLRAGSDFSFDDDLYGGIRLSVPLFQPRQQVRRQV